jgi:acyl-CoA synthetase (AMP-forming)/AMP-acid ligase II
VRGGADAPLVRDLTFLCSLTSDIQSVGPPVIERLLSVTRRLCTNYGMTETTSAITGIAPTHDVEVLANSVGAPFPGVEVRLVDENEHEVRDGAVGEIQARSPLNFLGYWRKPEETAAAVTPDGWFRTGDLGRRRGDGLYQIVGRRREMFKSGGYIVYPREIEKALEMHPQVRAAAVIGVPDETWQEVGVAFVTAEDGMRADELSAWLRERLANYKIPKKFVFLPELPLLPIGKVDKPALRRLHDRQAAIHPADGLHPGG